MKKNELLPTEENLINSLTKDTIGRNKDIEYFLNILKCQESSCALALNGRWGTGKTFFARQTEMYINASNFQSKMSDEKKSIIKNALTIKDYTNDTFAIYYDAWKNDNDADPIFSLICEITKQVDEYFSIEKFEVSDFITLSVSILDTIVNTSFKGLTDLKKQKDAFEKFLNQKDTEKLISEFFSKLLPERGNRLVIFIDELDRCKPTYAIRLLEQIKHYMMDDRITFVFSVNFEQLQHTIKCYYGADFDANRYLDRFFDLRMELPPIDMDKYYEKIGLNQNFSIEIVIKQIIKNYNFGLREMGRFIPQVKTAVYNIFDNDYNFLFQEGRSKEFIMIYIVPLMIGLRIASISVYNDFIEGKDSKPLQDLLSISELKPCLQDLLNGGEDLESDMEKECVSTQEIIDRLYDAIFKKQYSYNDYHTILGRYAFGKGSKQFAIKVSTMMSPYTELS